MYDGGFVTFMYLGMCTRAVNETRTMYYLYIAEMCVVVVERGFPLSLLLQIRTTHNLDITPISLMLSVIFSDLFF